MKTTPKKPIRAKPVEQDWSAHVAWIVFALIFLGCLCAAIGGGADRIAEAVTHAATQPVNIRR